MHYLQICMHCDLTDIIGNIGHFYIQVVVLSFHFHTVHQIQVEWRLLKPVPTIVDEDFQLDSLSLCERQRP